LTTRLRRSIPRKSRFLRACICTILHAYMYAQTNCTRQYFAWINDSTEITCVDEDWGSLLYLKQDNCFFELKS
jgi:hypothetical protein